MINFDFTFFFFFFSFSHSAKALSTVASTAAFDKNPQSQERGITLDLGFSSFLAPQFPEQLRSESKLNVCVFFFCCCCCFWSFVDSLFDNSNTTAIYYSGLPYDSLQFTLVDCPGHADLIRTIIGGAQIIDMMLLVIDVNKGIQTQTAEVSLSIWHI